MITYLKNMEGWKEVTKKKKVDDVQETAEVDDDQEAAKIKELMEIVLDEEEVAIDAIPLATKPPTIKLIKAKYGSTRPAEDLDLILWGDLKTMFEPHVEDRYKVNVAEGVNAASEEVSTAELVSTAYDQQERINAIDADEDITLVNVQDDAEIFDVNTLTGDEVFAELEVDAKDVNLTIDEVTLAQTLATLKNVKSKVKSVVIQEPSTTTTTISSQQPSQDKGKRIMVEEPVKTMKKKDLIRLDEETTKRLQAKFDEDERLAREKDEANVALIEEWDDIQAKIDQRCLIKPLTGFKSLAPGNQDNKNKESSRRSVPVETSTSTTLVSECMTIGGCGGGNRAISLGVWGEGCGGVGREVEWEISTGPQILIIPAPRSLPGSLRNIPVISSGDSAATCSSGLKDNSSSVFIYYRSDDGSLSTPGDPMYESSSTGIDTDVMLLKIAQNLT
ncbi:hypothetical protein Tco_0467838 [Tanacetum coccineum]